MRDILENSDLTQEALEVARALRRLTILINTISEYIVLIRKKLSPLYLKQPGIIRLSETIGMGWVRYYYENDPLKQYSTRDVNDMPTELQSNNLGIFSLNEIGNYEFSPQQDLPIMDLVAGAIEVNRLAQIFHFPNEEWLGLEKIIDSPIEELEDQVSKVEPLYLEKFGMELNSALIEHILNLVTLQYVLNNKIAKTMLLLIAKYKYVAELPKYLMDDEGIHFQCYDYRFGYPKYIFFRCPIEYHKELMDAYDTCLNEVSQSVPISYKFSTAYRRIRAKFQHTL